METTLAQNVFAKSKLLIKAGIIAAIILLLQIPTYYVQNLIEERESRQKEAIAEVSSKWAGRQNIMGPVLVVPYWETTNDTVATKNKTKHLAYFLADELTVNASVAPQEKYRGIYKVMLYSSAINFSGAFHAVQPQRLGLAPEDMIWNEAYLRISASDNKGLNDEVKLKVNDTTLPVLPFESDNPKDQSLYAPLSLNAAQAASGIQFSAQMSVNGSEQLLFTPTAKTTTVNLSSAWPHPSFTGNALPQTTTVKDTGFTAVWRSMSQKQAFPQQWKDDASKLISPSLATNAAASAFGVDLFVPVSGYQKTMRSIK
jgi:inner membrane protein